MWFVKDVFSLPEWVLYIELVVYSFLAILIITKLTKVLKFRLEKMYFNAEIPNVVKLQQLGYLPSGVDDDEIYWFDHSKTGNIIMLNYFLNNAHKMNEDFKTIAFTKKEKEILKNEFNISNNHNLHKVDPNNTYPKGLPEELWYEFHIQRSLPASMFSIYKELDLYTALQLRYVAKQYQFEKWWLLRKHRIISLLINKTDFNLDKIKELINAYESKN
jgi:hypothetical protein